jgi:hypothetical protein
MIIDQSLIDAGSFPQRQGWWDRFTPTWVTATVNGWHVTLTTAAPPETLQQWIGQFPRIACAVIPDSEAPYGTGKAASPC